MERKCERNLMAQNEWKVIFIIQNVRFEMLNSKQARPMMIIPWRSTIVQLVLSFMIPSVIKMLMFATFALC